MTRSVQDIAALLYTGIGSQRALGRALGLSHQKVGRLLRIGQEGGYSPDSRVLRDPALLTLLDWAIKGHTDNVKRISKLHGLPFSEAVPVFQYRMPLKVGQLGDRVEAPNLHWLSDKLRTEWLRKMHQTGRFYQVSIGSIVNLMIYENRGEARFRNKPRSEAQKAFRSQIRKQLREGIKTTMLQTPYSSFGKTENFSLLAQGIQNNLAEKHEPATGQPGTTLAARALFQVDTRHGKDNAFRTTHPIPKSESAKTIEAVRSQKRASRKAAKK